jgi:hypothetical protein
MFTVRAPSLVAAGLNQYETGFFAFFLAAIIALLVSALALVGQVSMALVSLLGLYQQSSLYTSVISITSFWMKG